MRPTGAPFLVDSSGGMDRVDAVSVRLRVTVGGVAKDPVLVIKIYGMIIYELLLHFISPLWFSSLFYPSWPH